MPDAFVGQMAMKVSVHMPSSSVQVRDTRQNAESSRSHQIVRIFVESRPSLPTMPEGGVAPTALALAA